MNLIPFVNVIQEYIVWIAPALIGVELKVGGSRLIVALVIGIVQQKLFDVTVRALFSYYWHSLIYKRGHCTPLIVGIKFLIKPLAQGVFDSCWREIGLPWMSMQH